MSILREVKGFKQLVLDLEVIHVLDATHEVVSLGESVAYHDVGSLLDALVSVLSDPEIILQLLLSEEFVAAAV